MNTLTRRSVIEGLVGLVAAPAIVRAQNIMPVRTITPSATEAGISGSYGFFPHILRMHGCGISDQFQVKDERTGKIIKPDLLGDLSWQRIESDGLVLELHNCWYWDGKQR